MSKRRATPPKRASAAAQSANDTPSSSAIATTPVALTTLCTPRRGRLIRPSASPWRSTVNVERPAARGDLDGAHVGSGAQPVRESAVAIGQVAAAGVVGAEHLRPGDVRQVPVEAVDDGAEGPVVVEMIDLDVGEHGGVQRQGEVGAVALVGLDDEQLAAGPLRPGAGVGDLTADDEARRQPGLGQHEHEHRRGGGLAVGAGDGDGARQGADRGQHAGPAHGRDAQLVGVTPLDVALRDRRGRGHGVAPLDVPAIVPHVHLHARRTQAIEHRLLA